MDRVDKWLSACDEETWLEEYNQVRFFSSLKDYGASIEYGFCLSLCLHDNIGH